MLRRQNRCDTIINKSWYHPHHIKTTSCQSDVKATYYIWTVLFDSSLKVWLVLRPLASTVNSSFWISLDLIFFLLQSFSFSLSFYKAIFLTNRFHRRQSREITHKYICFVRSSTFSGTWLGKNHQLKEKVRLGHYFITITVVFRWLLGLFSSQNSHLVSIVCSKSKHQ